jgi:hypothetical protein
MSYNGYTNFETWCVVTHLSNDEEILNTIQSLIRGKSDYEAKNTIELFIEERACVYEKDDPISLLITDLFEAAFQQVEFVTVAQNLRAEDDNE